MFKRMLFGAASMMALAASKAFDYSKMRLTDRIVAPPRENRHKKAKRGRGSKQRYDASRLIADRPSSIRKLQRWSRAGTIFLPEPDKRALMRHAWYRKQQEKAG